MMVVMIIIIIIMESDKRMGTNQWWAIGITSLIHC